jgi:transcriptional regulator with GAF, ATPase, and Fis domain/serine/threonine protein kinase/tetratricopeptide (TPR) repeat protein
MKTIVPERFTLVRRLRVDHKSIIFIGIDHATGPAEVLIKIIRKGQFDPDPSRLRQFFSWFKGVWHPHIATVLDAGLTTGQNLFYVREFLPTSELFAENQTPAMPLLVSVLKFMALNERVHGALKPSNVFFSSGSLKIADPRIEGVPETFETEESIRYTAPEALKGGKPNFESDLYSLGAILYRLLTGQNPFDDGDLNHLKAKYLYASPKPIIDLCHVSKSLSDSVGTLLDKDPSKRRIAFEALAESIGATTIFPRRAAFVGQTVLKDVTEILSSQRNASLRVILIEGEPGIGKSRFLEELRLHAAFQPKASVTSGQCLDSSTVPFHPILQGIRALLNTAPPQDLNTLWPALSKHLHTSDNSAKGHYPVERVVNELVGLLGSLARRTSILFALDDIEYADRGTEQFIEQLAFRASEVPLTLVLTRRPDAHLFKLGKVLAESLAGDFTRIRLRSLTAGESHTLATFLTGSADRQKLAVEMSAGNPRFLHEYAQSAEDSSSKLSTALNEAMSDLISKLDERLRPVAESLSLFEKAIELETLGKLCALDRSDLDARLLDLESLGLAELTDNRAVLKYPVLRLRLYASISRACKTHLNRLAFESLKSSGDLETVAHLALEARMLKEAADLYLQLARQSFGERKFTKALQFYLRFERCARVVGTYLKPDDRAKLGNCYESTGNLKRALRIYRSVLALQTVQRDSELLSSVYASLARIYEKKMISKRTHFHTLAIECLSERSPTITSRYLDLCNTLLRTGQVSAASAAFEKAVESSAGRHTARIEHIKGALYIHTANFKAAFECLSRSTEPDKTTEVVLNNLVVCLENLGRLQEARKIQLQAQEMAATNGFLPIQLSSLCNLGCIETKLGNMREAEESFNRSHTWLERLRNQEKEIDVASFSVTYSDAALHSMQTGKYGRSARYLCKLTPSIGSLFEMDRLVAEMVRCEFFLRLGQTSKVRLLLQRLKNSETFNTDFFQVEKALIASRLELTLSETTVSELQRVLAITERLETLYQKCKVLVRLAAVSVGLNQRKNAEAYAKDALQLAETHGYKPLAAEAFLWLGLATESPRDQQLSLTTALQNAAEMGLVELVAEISFHLGAVQMRVENFITAHEYLTKSVSILDDIVATVPPRLRARYLRGSWRREARKLLENCNRFVQSDPYWSAAQDRQGRDDRYFRGAYRFTISSSKGGSAESLSQALLDALAATLLRPVVITLKSRQGPITISVRIQLNDEVRERIESTRRRSNGHIYFGSADKGNLKDTVAWIPLHSEEYDGGIYVSCGQGESPFAEGEMEFLTIVGGIANGALHQLRNQPARQSENSEMTEFHGMIGASKAIRGIYSHIEIAAGNTATVLIEGESGTGKELVARAIHRAGPRAKEPFVAVDCGAIPEGLIEAELFGAKKGSYTGAVQDRPGLFEAAHRGTIFLDEISNTSVALQAKLLRVIQEREVRRIGETKGRTIDVRLIVATNANLASLAQDGRFRKDLLYRLNVLHITVPPLRNRRDDIPMLAHAFLGRLNTTNKTKKYFAPGVVNRFSAHNFPGNVRELQNAIERAYFSSREASINEVRLEERATDNGSSPDEIQAWFKELSEGRRDFWTAVHNRYKRRDISREKVIALVDYGLRSTRGNYKTMAAMFRLKGSEYRRFMDFLRRNDCLLDFRPYRKAADTE